MFCYPAANTNSTKDKLTRYLPRVEVHSACSYRDCPFFFWLAFLLIWVIRLIRQSSFCMNPRFFSCLSSSKVHIHSSMTIVYAYFLCDLYIAIMALVLWKKLLLTSIHELTSGYYLTSGDANIYIITFKIDDDAMLLTHTFKPLAYTIKHISRFEAKLLTDGYITKWMSIWGLSSILIHI